MTEEIATKNLVGVTKPTADVIVATHTATNLVAATKSILPL